MATSEEEGGEGGEGGEALGRGRRQKTPSEKLQAHLQLKQSKRRKKHHPEPPEYSLTKNAELQLEECAEDIISTSEAAPRSNSPSPAPAAEAAPPADATAAGKAPAPSRSVEAPAKINVPHPPSPIGLESAARGGVSGSVTSAGTAVAASTAPSSIAIAAGAAGSKAKPPINAASAVPSAASSEASAAATGAVVAGGKEVATAVATAASLLGPIPVGVQPSTFTMNAASAGPSAASSEASAAATGAVAVGGKAVATAVATAASLLGPIPVGVQPSTYTTFMGLPENDEDCDRVDENGTWVFCNLCKKKVPVREGRPYTAARWNGHKTESGHLRMKEKQLNDKQLAARVKLKDPTLSNADRRRYKDISKKGTKLTAFMKKVPSKKASSSVSSLPSAARSGGDGGAMDVDAEPAAVDVDAEPLEVERGEKPQKQKPKTCEGVFPKYRADRALRADLTVYERNCAVPGASDFKMDIFGGRAQVFAALCDGTGGLPRRGHNMCDKCYAMKGSRANKIRQTIKARAAKHIVVEEALRRSELSSSDYTAIKNFANQSGDSLSPKGKELKERARVEQEYYEQIEGLSQGTKNSVCAQSRGLVPSGDKFLDGFLELYHAEGGAHKDSLVFCLVRAYVAKAKGTPNPKYGHKVVNFMLALAATNMKAMDFVSANLGSMSIRHLQTLRAARRGKPVILRTPDDITALVAARIGMIRKGFNDDSMRVAFTVGLDATVLVKGWQLIASESTVVGGAYPNHSFDVANKAKADLLAFLKECIAGDHGDHGTEIKVAVVSFQVTPQGMCPYLIAGGIPQTNNDTNSWGTEVVDACAQAASQSKNAVLLNEATDGVSVETKKNLSRVCNYLSAESNVLALVDTNHNVKNGRYHIVGGGSASSIGKHCIDPWIFKMANVTKEITVPSDFASDALVLATASAKVAKAILQLECADAGNVLVTAVSLMFIRIRSYAVNARRAEWGERAAFTWASMLWFTSFHKSGSTMLTNMRNMVLESVAVLFLVSRSDVSQPRRATSEPNEHTYGTLRQIQREFTVEQFVRLVQKLELKMNSIFEGDLATSRSNIGKGYQKTFPDFVQSLKDASANRPPVGPIDIDLSEDAVVQLWPAVKDVIHKVNERMKPFLKLFGSEEGNGVSPFLAEIDEPSDLLALVEDFFRPPKRDPRDMGQQQAVVVEIDDDEFNDSDDEEVAEQGDFVPSFVEDIASTAIEDDDEGDGGTAAASADANVETDDVDASDGADADLESFFDDGKASEALLELKALLGLQSQQIPSIGTRVLKIMQLLQLGKIEQGSLLPDGKYTSLNARWFGSKKKKKDDTVPKENADDDDALFIERNRIIKMKCKRGKSESNATYRVLAIFSKHYNKWYVHWDSDRVPFEPGSKKYKVLARMVVKNGSSYEEVELEKDGHWGPRAVYCIKHMSEIVSVEETISEDTFSW